MFFVCLPCRYIAREPVYLELFRAHRLNPELCIDAWSLQNKDQAWFERLAATLAKEGLSCSVHLPYENLHPGGGDELILDATRKRLALAMECAKLFMPQFMIGHVDFSQALHGWERDAWLERHTATWEGLLDAWPGHPPLHLENTFEQDPEPVRDAVVALKDRGVGLCFDAPHWHAFSHGWERKDLKRWLTCFAPHLTHLHLHDNDGSGDQHLGLGQGTLPWGEVFAFLESQGITPGMTLEPHDEPSFRASQEYLLSHPQWFGRLFA